MFIKPIEIYRYRQRKYWKQRQLAEDRGVDVRTVKRWEKFGLNLSSRQWRWSELREQVEHDREFEERVRLQRMSLSPGKGDNSTGSRKNVTKAGEGDNSAIAGCHLEC